jgi:hypothetical protein
MDFEQDYIDLFLHKRKGHMGKYTYIEEGQLFNLFNSRRESIKNIEKN